MKRKAKPITNKVERIDIALRGVGEQIALTREMIASHFALQRTERAGFDFLYSRGGTSTAGELSKATGLTSGSTTALIDRLVMVGYAVREPDPNDRRKQIVRIPERVFADCEAVYAPIRAEMFRFWSSYSVEDLEVVEDFLTRSTQLHGDCLRRSRTSVADASKRGRAGLGKGRARS
jgi:DNA-binding MarR family transcriptional regulator